MQGNKYFESQGDNEEVILVIRRYFLGIFQEMIFAVISFILIFVFFGAVAVFFPILIQGYGYNICVLLWSLLMLFVTLFIFTVWSLHYLNVAIITNEHLAEIDQKGVFTRDVSVMTLDKLQDISASQDGFFPNMFNYGKIHIQTAGELPNFVLEFVKDPHGVAKKIIEVTKTYHGNNRAVENEDNNNYDAEKAMNTTTSKQGD
ncbi:MAG: PH domain-containing protein [bacterium]